MKNDISTEQKELEKIRRIHVAGKLLKELLVLLIVIVALIPLVWVVFLSLKTNNEIFFNPLSFPEEIQWGNYTTAFRKIPFIRMLKNTFTEMIIAIPVGMFISMCSSFAIAKIRFGNDKWNNTLYTYFIAGIIIPGFVLLFPVYLIMNKIGLYDSLLGMALVHISWCAPMNTAIMVNAFRGIPSVLEEAAAIDGCGIWKILFKVYMPLMKPTMVTIFILSFLSVWNDFVLARVLLLSNDLQTISMASALFKGLYSTDYAMMTAAIVILVIPQLAVFAGLQKHIIDGITAGAVKG
ncbi:carbohydrate ABC transporter permease [bacterium 1XD21-13]|nr:carbohydrate ABC transporter permease [bacterium 1XD21-13]